jgi:putative transposase
MPTYQSQSTELTAVRAADKQIGAMPLEIQRSALRRVDRAFSGFFRRCKNEEEKPGYPRFRAYDRYRSFEIGRVLPLAEGAMTRHARLRIPKLGLVRFHEYRSLRGKVLDVTIRRTATGKWLVCFVCDLGDAPAKVPVRDAVGIDVGLTTYATLSDGAEVPNPRYGRKGEVQLAHRQQALARKQRGSNGRRRAKLLVAKAYEHIKNQRLDYARRVAAVLVAKYDLIAYEDLNIRGLVRGWNSKSVSDAAWGQLVHALTCKAEEAGKWCVPVDPRGTSQRCSMCGATVSKTLADREHRCACGCVLGRDHNAARNILALGRSVAAGLA